MQIMFSHKSINVNMYVRVKPYNSCWHKHQFEYLQDLCKTGKIYRPFQVKTNFKGVLIAKDRYNFIIQNSAVHTKPDEWVLTHPDLQRVKQYSINFTSFSVIITGM